LKETKKKSIQLYFEKNLGIRQIYHTNVIIYIIN